jgi:MIP family channel proteins
MDRKALLAEFVGTFTLVFLGAGAGALASQTGAGLVGVALAHGIALMVIVYAWGHVSGAHVNPAVTVALAAAGRTPWRTAAGYIASQLTGAGVAGFLLLGLLGDTGRLGMTLPAVSPLRAVVVEAVLTWFLVTAVFGSAVAGKNGNAAGLAIGMVLAADILMGGSLTGASMNPARSFGPALAMMDFDSFWIYIVGPIAGAVPAALVYETWILRPAGAAPARTRKGRPARR